MDFLDPRLPRRFWKKAIPEPNTGCWIWTGSTNQGYGRLKFRGKRLYAHRWAYERIFGRVPSGLVSDHLCRVRCCVNPAHIELVSDVENIRRGFRDRRRLGIFGKVTSSHCRKGHELSPENTLVAAGYRRCRKCVNANHRKSRARKRAA